MAKPNFDFYHKAVALDDAFQRALVLVYGAKNAGDARYRLSHADPLVQTLADAKVAADNAWHAEVERSRRES